MYCFCRIFEPEEETLSLLFYLFALMALVAGICQAFMGDWLFAAGFALAILVNIWIAHKIEREEIYR